MFLQRNKILLNFNRNNLFFTGSLITKAWRSAMEEWDHTAKQLKINAELLESVCKDKLTHLHQEKQKARKAYQEEHSKIAAQFNNVSFISFNF